MGEFYREIKSEDLTGLLARYSIRTFFSAKKVPKKLVAVSASLRMLLLGETSETRFAWTVCRLCSASRQAFFGRSPANATGVLPCLSLSKEDVGAGNARGVHEYDYHLGFTGKYISIKPFLSHQFFNNASILTDMVSFMTLFVTKFINCCPFW